MKNRKSNCFLYHFVYTILVFLVSCNTTKNEICSWYIIRDYNHKSIDGTIFGYASGYIDSKGDTIIPLGKYLRCYTDTVKTFAIVLTKKHELIGIDKSEKKLFNAVWGLEAEPMRISEGMLLITESNNYGYSNEKGEIVIKPKYKCAESFYQGKAKVSNHCRKIRSENKKWIMDSWFYIDKEGQIVDD